MSTIAENIARIRDRIYNRALKIGRNPDEVTLVAVSKTVEIARVREAIAAGLTTFGENYVQEAQEKIVQIGQGLTWHMIGHLQTNKVKYVVSLFSMIQSVDSLRLAQEISERAIRVGKPVDILMQVNIGAEGTKTGLNPDQVIAFLEDISPLKGIQVKGLMTMPPYFPDPELARPFFQKLRRLRDHILPFLSAPHCFPHLSMGMSGDFEVAIEEGATIVRIGTAIFGARE